VDTVYILASTLGGGLSHAVEVYRQLRELELELLPGGALLHNGVYVVGKGTNSVVFRCKPRVGNLQLACKIRRGDSTRSSLALEGQYLHLANTVGVGPRLYTYSKDVLAYRFINGVDIATWWKSATPEKRRSLVQDLLTQTFLLDEIGLSHNELARLRDHVLVEEDKPVIMDFESASLGKSRNVTQVANGLSHLGLKPPLEALRRYKATPCKDSFTEVLLGFLSQL